MEAAIQVVRTVLLTWLVAVLGTAAAADLPTSGAGPWTSASGQFRLSYHSDLTPIVINQIHGWTLHLETSDGEPVEHAEITVSGGMPAHNHGLPTAPQVTAELGGGYYRLEGMRFHMLGYWEIKVELQVGDRHDTFTLPLQL